MMYHLKSFYRYHIRGRWHYLKAAKMLESSGIPIVVYTMGKVGSLSIYHSLKNYTQQPVFHLHTLRQEIIDWEYQTCREKGWWPDSKSVGGLLYEKKVLPQKTIQLITTVRNPIERNISAFFEVFRYYNGSDAATFVGNQLVLEQQFLEKVPHDFPLNWFDEELKVSLGIDVYKTAFDPMEKLAFYSQDNLQLLLFRVDLPDDKKETSLKQFLGLSDFVLKNHNIGEQKAYADLYQSFKSNLVLPPAYIEQQLNSKYCQHFYSMQERKDLYQKWVKH